jgi:predicted nucleic acid-binding protein
LRFLLDTNIVSELRKLKPHGGVLAWYEAHPQSAYAIPVLALFELQEGAEMTRHQNAPKADELDIWIDDVSRRWPILPLDGAAAREAARYLHKKSPHLIEDGMIAAIAHVHGLTVATRNTKDFEQFGIAVTNPFLYK